MGGRLSEHREHFSTSKDGVWDGLPLFRLTLWGPLF